MDKTQPAQDKYAPSDPFEKWWYYEGSAPPYTHHDCEEHTKRMCKIAWSNGATGVTQPAQEPVARVLQIIKELRQAIEQAEKQEPVGKFAKFTDGVWREVTNGSAGISLYTDPPQRTWVGLTDEEIDGLHDEIKVRLMGTFNTKDIYRVLEAKLKEKNT